MALSGGGIRGFAHVGALTAMHKYGIKPEIIAGTSAGSIVGALYADGYAPEEMYEIFRNLKLKKIASSNYFEGSLLKMTGLQKILKTHLRAKRFEDLNMPLRIIASDIEEGKPRCFSTGELIPAVLASCAVPIIFSPVEIDGHYYMDGGVFDNFPVKYIRKECRTVLGINVRPVNHIKYDQSLKYMIERVMNYTIGANTKEAIKMCDYYITDEEFSNHWALDTKGAQMLYELGHATADTYLKDNRERLEESLRSSSL